MLRRSLDPDSRPDPGRALARVPLWARDLLIALALVVGLWLIVPQSTPESRIWQLVLASACAVAVMLRRVASVPAAAVAITATVAATALSLTADPCIMAGLCLFTVAERRGTRAFPAGLVIGLCLVGLVLITVAAESLPAGARSLIVSLIISLVVITVAWALGTRTRQVRIQSDSRARADERLRLSREVHDVLSHSLGAIGVQAGVAAHVPTLGAEELRGTLREVETDARASLAELNDLLHRERGESPGAPLTVSLDEFARRLERSGVRANVDVSGDPAGVPLAHAQTIRRLVQEATTNIIRHSGASTCWIVVRCEAPEITVEIGDDGHGAGGDPREGHGLTGMRERVALLGGTFAAGGENGFAVSARLPLPLGGKAP